jgi:hypothetical protein
VVEKWKVAALGEQQFLKHIVFKKSNFIIRYIDVSLLHMELRVTS